MFRPQILAICKELASLWMSTAYEVTFVKEMGFIRQWYQYN